MPKSASGTKDIKTNYNSRTVNTKTGSGAGETKNGSPAAKGTPKGTGGSTVAKTTVGQPAGGSKAPVNKAVANTLSRIRSEVSAPPKLGIDGSNKGIYTRALSDSQLANPNLKNPNTAGYRAAIKQADTMGGTIPQQIDNTYKALGLKDHQRAAILGRNAVESGYFNPKVIGRDVHTGDLSTGGATGLGQWHDDRMVGVRSFIGGMDSPFGNPTAQAAAIMHEMQTSPAERTAFKTMNKATNIQEAMKAMNQFERPKGFTYKHPEGSHVTGYDDAMGVAKSYNPAYVQKPQVTHAFVNPVNFEGGASMPIDINPDGTAASTVDAGPDDGMWGGKPAWHGSWNDLKKAATDGVNAVVSGAPQVLSKAHELMTPANGRLARLAVAFGLGGMGGPPVLGRPGTGGSDLETLAKPTPQPTEDPQTAWLYKLLGMQSKGIA